MHFDISRAKGNKKISNKDEIQGLMKVIIPTMYLSYLCPVDKASTITNAVKRRKWLNITFKIINEEAVALPKLAT